MQQHSLKFIALDALYARAVLGLEASFEVRVMLSQGIEVSFHLLEILLWNGVEVASI